MPEEARFTGLEPLALSSPALEPLSLSLAVCAEAELEPLSLSLSVCTEAALGPLAPSLVVRADTTWLRLSSTACSRRLPRLGSGT
jgi:hypothetical protein